MKTKLLNQLSQKHNIDIDPSTEVGAMIIEFAELSERFYSKRIRSLAKTHQKRTANRDERIMRKINGIMNECRKIVSET